MQIFPKDIDRAQQRRKKIENGLTVEREKEMEGTNCTADRGCTPTGVIPCESPIDYTGAGPQRPLEHSMEIKKRCECSNISERG